MHFNGQFLGDTNFCHQKFLFLSPTFVCIVCHQVLLSKHDLPFPKKRGGKSRKGSKGGKAKSKMDVLDVLADLIKALMIDDMDDTDFKNALDKVFVALLGGAFNPAEVGDRNLRDVDKALLKLNKDDLTRKLTDLLRKLDEY